VCSALATQPAVAGVLSFTSPGASVSENAVSVTINISRTGDASGAASVTVSSADATATAPDDYGSVNQVVNWNAGDSASKTVNISINDNAAENPQKTFTLTLGSATGDSIGAVGTMSIYITDHEEGKIEFKASSFAFTEGQSSATIDVIRKNGSDGIVSATITSTDGTAEAGIDFAAVSTSITMASGEASTKFTVPLIDDSSGEPDEAFVLTLSSPTGNAAIGEVASASISIRDDDPDFTPNSTKIDNQINGATQVNLIDLGASSALTPTKSYLELLNAIPTLSEPGIEATQNSSGLIELSLGEDTYYLRPKGISRDDRRKSPTISINGTASINFVIGDGLIIEATPAIASIASFLDELALILLPKLTVSDTGNVLIQVDQGPPKYEKLPNGDLTLSNSFYDKWNLRPYPYASEIPSIGTGVIQIKHPTFEDESLIAHYFTADQKTRVQYFAATALIESELDAGIKGRTGVLSVDFIIDGTIKVEVVSEYDSVTNEVSKANIFIFPDYMVTRVPAFTSNMSGFYDKGDINGDGRSDYLMIYSTGYQQIFYGKSNGKAL